MSLFTLFVVLLKLAVCQTPSVCPENPISGVPFILEVGGPLCMCPGAPDLDNGFCSNGGNCSGGVCSWPICSTTDPVPNTTLCFCDFIGLDEPVCFPGTKCTSEGCVYPPCTSHITPVTEPCLCLSDALCFAGMICSNGGDCIVPACPTDTPVTNYCTCGSDDDNICKPYENEYCVPTGGYNGTGFCGPICPETVTNYECKCGSTTCDVYQTCSAGSCVNSACAGDGSSEPVKCACGTTAVCDAGDICTPGAPGDPGSCGTPGCTESGSAEPFSCTCGSASCSAGEACDPSGNGSCTTPNCENGVEPISTCTCNTNDNCNSGYIPTGCVSTGTAGSCVLIEICNSTLNTQSCRCGSSSPYTSCTAGQDCHIDTKTCTTPIPSCPSGIPATAASCKCGGNLCGVGETCSLDGGCTNVSGAGGGAGRVHLFISTALAVVAVVMLL